MLNTTLQNQAFQARALNRQATELAYVQADLENQLDARRPPRRSWPGARRRSGMRPNPYPGVPGAAEGQGDRQAETGHRDRGAEPDRQDPRRDRAADQAAALERRAGARRPRRPPRRRRPRRPPSRRPRRRRRRPRQSAAAKKAAEKKAAAKKAREEGAARRGRAITDDRATPAIPRPARTAGPASSRPVRCGPRAAPGTVRNRPARHRSTPAANGSCGTARSSGPGKAGSRPGPLRAGSRVRTRRRRKAADPAGRPRRAGCTSC